MIYDTYLKSDMLSMKKIKLHGMSEPRWTTKDKRIQYKGLINLYKRDKKIMFVDKKYALKRDKDTVISLKKKLVQSRFALDNAIFGDRQKMRNALAGDRRLQLAYQDLSTEKITENIHQENFICRKQLDLLRSTELDKSKTLARLKLRAAVFEDRIIYAAPGNLPVEMKCQRFTAKVQDAILKKEAAIVINETYKKIIDVCKRDAIYFDVILESLRADRCTQGGCMLHAIMLGQQAMEYLDDRKGECKLLERIVKRDMQERQDKLDEVTKIVFSFRRNLKFFVRRSDATLPVSGSKFSNVVHITAQLNFVCHIMDRLKKSFSTNNYFSLMKCLEDQFHQKERLEQLYEKGRIGRDTLCNKIDHATTIHDNLYNSMVETTVEYKQRKHYLLKQTQKQEEIIKNSQRLREKKWNLFESIKVSLQNLEQRCKYIKGPESISTGKKGLFLVPSALREKISAEEVVNIKANPLEIIEILVPKLLLLSTNAVLLTDTYQQSMAQEKMQDLVFGRTKSIPTDKKRILESLIADDIGIEDAQLPTRVEMKANSKYIVQLHTVNEDLIPMFDVRSKFKKKRK